MKNDKEFHDYFYRELDELRGYYDNNELINHLEKPINRHELDLLDFVRGDVERFSKLHQRLFKTL